MLVLGSTGRKPPAEGEAMGVNWNRVKNRLFWFGLAVVFVATGLTLAMISRRNLHGILTGMAIPVILGGIVLLTLWRMSSRKTFTEKKQSTRIFFERICTERKEEG